MRALPLLAAGLLALSLALPAGTATNPCGVAICFILVFGACADGVHDCPNGDLACATAGGNPLACVHLGGPDALACAWVVGKGDVACVPDPCPPTVDCYRLP